MEIFIHTLRHLVMFDGFRLIPANTGWNNRNTQNGNKKIENSVMTVSFPIAVPGGSSITSAKINACWDDYYSGATRIGEPSWDMNCHGYSTGLGYWVEGPGYSTVLDNDWKECASKFEIEAGCSRSEGGDHSIRVDEVVLYEYTHNAVSKTSEKMAYAGTYEKWYMLPAGANFGGSGTYRKR